MQVWRKKLYPDWTLTWECDFSAALLVCEEAYEKKRV